MAKPNTVHSFFKRERYLYTYLRYECIYIYVHRYILGGAISGDTGGAGMQTCKTIHVYIYMYIYVDVYACSTYIYIYICLCSTLSSWILLWMLPQIRAQKQPPTYHSSGFLKRGPCFLETSISLTLRVQVLCHKVSTQNRHYDS